MLLCVSAAAVPLERAAASCWSTKSDMVRAARGAVLVSVGALDAVCADDAGDLVAGMLAL